MPRSKFTNERREAFLQLAARGYDVSKICRAIGIGRKTFYRWCEQHEEFAEQVEKARAQGELKLADKAWKMALDGDGSMIRFILSRRFGWSTTHKVEVKEADLAREAMADELALLSPDERAAVTHAFLEMEWEKTHEH